MNILRSKVIELVAAEIRPGRSIKSYWRDYSGDCRFFVTRSSGTCSSRCWQSSRWLVNTAGCWERRCLFFLCALCFIDDPVRAFQEMWRVTGRAVALGLLDRQSLLRPKKTGAGQLSGCRLGHRGGRSNGRFSHKSPS